MVTRIILAILSFARQLGSQSASWAVFARDTASGFITTTHHTLMVFGVTAIAVLGIMYVKPEIADHIKAISPFAQKSTEEVPSPFMDVPAGPITTEPITTLAPANAEAPANKTASLPAAGSKNSAGREQQWVTNWLSKRYRVAGDAANMLVSHAYMTAKDIKLDPLLILAVMAIESGFNPYAESPVGAQGLMQVMSKVHHDKFQELGGVKAALNPLANIKVGSLILKDYVTRGGSVEAGLKRYVGAADSESDSGYGAKVLAEYRRLKEVARGKHVPIYAATANVAPSKPRLAERTTSPKPNTLEQATSTPNEQSTQPIKSDQVAVL
jgi:soluble lytic murein transglycosylase-like protein